MAATAAGTDCADMDARLNALLPHAAALAAEADRRDAREPSAAAVSAAWSERTRARAQRVVAATRPCEHEPRVQQIFEQLFDPPGPGAVSP